MPTLTDIVVRNSKPSAKPYKISDGDGLYLLVNATGKYWRFNYRFAGKQKTLALGVYPDLTLKAAREKLAEARRLLANGVDPSMAKQLQKAAKREAAANSFEAVAREWFAKHSPRWKEGHAGKIIARLERDVYPWMGPRPISEITPPELLAVMRRIEDRGVLETAHRAMQNCSQIFRYAVATGRCERDPSQDLKGALPPTKTRHFPSITDPKAVGDLLQAIESYQGSLIVKSALRVAPLVFVRPGELRNAEWKDIDFDRAEWRYVVSKTNTGHIVPLSTQAVGILRELQPLTGHGAKVFPGNRGEGTLDGFFEEADRTTMEIYTEIVNRFDGFMKVNSTKSGADPVVVAVAAARRIPVVTYETMAKQNAAPKIPNVCQAMGVDCVSLVDVLRAEGIRL